MSQNIADQSSFAGVASLLPFPARLQEVLIEAVMSAEPQRATDIWYEDESNKTVFVMRHGLNWQLNETASMLWERLDGPAKGIVEGLCEEYPSADRDEVRFSVAEFLLNAESHGLIELFPDYPADESETAEKE
jgi:Coenzyme PQQ synthesis protein D (PqqD)